MNLNALELERKKAWEAGRDAAALESDKFADSESCKSHDNDPCCHVRTGATISCRIRELVYPGPSSPKAAPIFLNATQKKEIEDWAAMPNNRWADTPARRINLTTFARSILKGPEPTQEKSETPKGE